VLHYVARPPPPPPLARFVVRELEHALPWSKITPRLRLHEPARAAFQLR
jgi:hypothetical protein